MRRDNSRKQCAAREASNENAQPESNTELLLGYLYNTLLHRHLFFQVSYNRAAADAIISYKMSSSTAFKFKYTKKTFAIL